ncbi:tRNA 5-methoxyuridine(34)/uridine 5-oxyacetic acid(34) synthase CmoB [Oceanicoccus sagamiensis]|uniref:tRNA U34 carboxymethyltransferase n=1 Tax=Oceanicoccus sagamiensis TaxID=716816 RepID=A0A1X9NBT1_9GAMM|nr:tRNA 5-methoxyuridine(34)/uridine 5-oxyacetic acid(34) synthase CmoB [Oceanicoccus sagamiensis]ARN74631.1 tRNA 5-methoxyuridine(34)/uridine 5-oxyacetic acid(34) synthase CmoB [Oceanicoccus sagamiensis]
MIDYQPFLQQLNSHDDYRESLGSWLQQIPEQISKGLDEKRYGDLPRWKSVLAQLPDWPIASYDLNQAAISLTGNHPLSPEQQQDFQQQLQGLHPWRKGPFNLMGVEIDTEWRSDWKWDRLKDHIEPLNGRKVLDIGCGSGYHCWRMRGAGAELVIGIDPTPLFIVQFFTLQKYIQDHHVTVLPMGIEHLPHKMRFFDTVFSMGVLYHRRSPFDHLMELRDSLCQGGELVLETLVIEGKEGEVLVPEGRYARMGNVWFLPSCPTMMLWLKKVGFKDIQLVDVTDTSTEEQRSTEWMTFHSLQQFLDPEDSSKSIEGYPAPRRAIFTAKAP